VKVFGAVPLGEMPSRFLARRFLLAQRKGWVADKEMPNKILEGFIKRPTF